MFGPHKWLANVSGTPIEATPQSTQPQSVSEGFSVKPLL